MKRDMDLIRQIVFKIEDDETGELNSTQIEIPGYKEDQVAYHCELLYESKYIDCIDASHLGSRYRELLINRLTSKGHDFADSSRNDSVWKRTLTTVKTTVGGVTIDVLLQYLKLEIRKTLGMPSES